jgi:hypothetical protein
MEQVMLIYFTNNMLLSTYKSLLTALGINKNLWPANGNHTLDMAGLGLMYIDKSPTGALTASTHFGYPHLGRPTDHFQVTPFEAIYCDPQTYEHIKMQASIDDNAGYDDNYLVYIRDFILDEVEADIVCLQNKIIGKNHILDQTYKYRAWYRAYDQIWIGNKVSPKTDPGDYIIEKTGDITVYAKNSISIKPGFHAQAGSDFHAFIGYESCSRPR